VPTIRGCSLRLRAMSVFPVNRVPSRMIFGQSLVTMGVASGGLDAVRSADTALKKVRKSQHIIRPRTDRPSCKRPNQECIESQGGRTAVGRLVDFQVANDEHI